MTNDQRDLGDDAAVPDAGAEPVHVNTCALGDGDGTGEGAVLGLTPKRPLARATSAPGS